MVFELRIKNSTKILRLKILSILGHRMKKTNNNKKRKIVKRQKKLSIQKKLPIIYKQPFQIFFLSYFLFIFLSHLCRSIVYISFI